MSQATVVGAAQVITVHSTAIELYVNVKRKVSTAMVCYSVHRFCIYHESSCLMVDRDYYRALFSHSVQDLILTFLY